MMRLAELRAALDSMDVPDMRKQLRPEDVRWLQRNLAVRNSEHPQFKAVMDRLRELTGLARFMLDDLYNRKTQLAHIDKLTEEEIAELAHVNAEIAILQHWS